MAKQVANLRIIAGRRVAIDRPIANDTLVWDENRAEWVPKPPGSSSSPLTTKGDIFSRTAGGDDNFPIGAATDGDVLTVDSTQTFGMKWAAAAGGAITVISSTTGIAVAGNRGKIYWLQVTGEPDRLIAVGLKADGSTYEWRELLVFGP